jgi:hypothetical protein
MVYLTNAVSYWLFGSGIGVSKLAGVAALFLALLVLPRAARLAGASCDAVIWVGIAAASMLGFSHISYWNRPDPFLVLCVSAALLHALRPLAPSRAIVIGSLAGVCFMLKTHGPVYLLPALALEWNRKRPSLKETAIAAALCGTVIAASFAPSQIQVRQYVESVWIPLRHGIDPAVLATSVVYLFLLLTPLIATIFVNPDAARDSRVKWFIAALLIASGVVLVVSGKPGAGPHHLLPLVPSIAIACALTTNRGVASAADKGHLAKSFTVGIALLAGSFGVLTAAALESQARIVVRSLLHQGEVSAATKEMDAIASDPSAGSVHVGYAGWSTYALTFTRPIVVFHGHSYWLDAAALGDYDAAGIEFPPGMVERLRNCSVKTWVLPKSEAPFFMPGRYVTRHVTGANKFGDRFADVFIATYERVSSTSHFDVWRCK